MRGSSSLAWPDSDAPPHLTPSLSTSLNSAFVSDLGVVDVLEAENEVENVVSRGLMLTRTKRP